MSGIDVEALLESTAEPGPKQTSEEAVNETVESEPKREHGDRRNRDRDRERYRDGSRDLDRDRRRRDRSRREKDADGDEEMKSPKSDRASANGSYRSRKRSKSRDSEKRRSRRDRFGEDAYRSSGGAGGDFYRGDGRTRSRSRSPRDDRYYRPTGRPRRDGEERGDEEKSRRREKGGRRRSPSPKRRSKTPEAQLTEDERDRRTVFVQQLAARLRTKELIAFFEKVGPVKEAQIVKDRVSGRSKG